jgi:uncharacterized protein
MNWFHINIESFSFALKSILFEGIPFLLLGSLISGFVDVFVSSERLAKLIPKSRVGSIFTAGLMGLIFPICECGSVVVVRRFVLKGLPVSAAICYMLAAPIVSPIVAISTYKAFSIGQIGGAAISPMMIVILRLSMGYAIAVIIALIIQQLPQNRILQPGLLGAESTSRRTGLRFLDGGSDSGQTIDFTALVAKSSLLGKLILAIKSAATDFIDVAFFFVIGASLASLSIGFKESSIEWLATAPSLSIVVLMLVAMILCLCSTTDAFVAANAFSQFSLAANLGFLVFGPMFDLKLFWLYGMIFKRRFVFLLGFVMFLLVFLFSWRLGFIDTWQQRPAQTTNTQP